MEIHADVVEGLNQGRIPIDEPGLHDRLQEALEQGRFRAQLTPEPAEAFMLCAPTLFKDNNQPDMIYVEAFAA